MKNKKLLNVYLLCLSLLALITFILPFPKTAYESGVPLGIEIVYYATNVLMLIALCLIIILSIINLFSDEYSGLNLIFGLSLVALIMVFVNLLMYACNWYYAIAYGYILVAVEVFVLYGFNHVIKIIYSMGEFKNYIVGIFSKGKKIVISQPETPVKPNPQTKPTKIIKPSQKSKSAEVADTKTNVSDNMPENVANNPDITTGEKE